MEPRKRDIYQKPGERNGMGCIHIEAIRNDRVEYTDVLGWNFGWPTMGLRHSTSLAQFERDAWQYVEPVD